MHAVHTLCKLTGRQAPNHHTDLTTVITALLQAQHTATQITGPSEWDWDEINRQADLWDQGR